MTLSVNRKIIEDSAALDAIQHTFIKHPRADYILESVIKVIEKKAYHREHGNTYPAENLCIYGDAGTGKTFLCEYLLNKYPTATEIHSTAEVTKQPIVLMSIVGKALHNLTSSILTSLNAPYPDRGNVSHKTERIKALMDVSETNLLILDEFNNLFSNVNPKDLVDWIVSLINISHVPVLVVGTPEVQKLIKQNPTTSRRFRMLKLDRFPFYYNGNDWELLKYVMTFTSRITKTYPEISFPDFKNSPQLLLKLYLATMGYIANINSILALATDRALETGKLSINTEDLSFIFSILEPAHVSNHHNKNPFILSDAEALKLFNRI